VRRTDAKGIVDTWAPVLDPTSFTDPNGNRWLLHEITTRRSGRDEED
jgi:hypothetical protein